MIGSAMRRIAATAVAASAIASASALNAQEEPLDYDAINQIRDLGFNHSEVMETLRMLTDVIGPRLSASPAMREANDWTRAKFEEWGLENAHLEPFEFGRGWSFSNVNVRMITPRPHYLQALPLAWHPGTDGTLRAEIAHVVLNSNDDLEDFDEDVAGKIVLISDGGGDDEPNDQQYIRWSEAQLAERAKLPVPTGDRGRGFGGGRLSAAERDAFLAEQGAVAIIRRSFRYGTLISGAGHGYDDEETPPLPALSMTQTDYDRLLRLLEHDETVTLEIMIEAQFHEEDRNAYNTIAEIPGRTRNAEIVMAGAHLDSWYGGDGAVDNAAGSSVVMEAARILSSMNIRPRRTIRFALWSGEEQGLHGSRHHVKTHFAERPEDEDESDEIRPDLRIKRDHARLSAYFNLDNGAGRIRGVYAEGNSAAAAIFRRWLEPFHDLEARTVTTRRTGGTDHRAFQAVGLPGYQFIQDPLDYGARRHHTQADVYFPYYEADLKQASVIMAAFLYHAAMREERFPRKPMPE
ncbi:MAG: M28 family metallopeptidase [Parvularculaceae bacterium]